MLLAGGLELLGVSFQPGLCLGDGLALPLREVRETRRQRLLHPVEIARPLGEPLFDAALDEAERFAELACDTPLPLGHLASTGVCELPLLVGDPGGRIGACPRQSPFELLRPSHCLALDQRAQPGLGLIQLGIDAPAPGEACAERDRQQRRGKADSQPAGSNGCASVDIEREDGPTSRCSQAEQTGDSGEQAARAPPGQRRGDRDANEENSGGEADLNDGLGRHDHRW